MYLEVLIMYLMHMLITFYIGIFHITKERKHTYIHTSIVRYASKYEDQNNFIYIFKKYGVIVQNGAFIHRIHIWSIHHINTTSMLEVLGVCHDNTLWHLQDVGRAPPTNRVHPPPVVVSPLEDPPPGT
jgi:hypothetical protein